MKTTIKFTILFIISIALFNCSSDTNSTTQEEEEEESNAIPQVNTIVSSFAGDTETTYQTGYENGQGANAKFNFPWHITFDNADNLFVADSRNHVIRKITPTGNVTTYAGSGQDGYEDGASNVATFKLPTDLVFDSQGNLL